MPNNITYFLGKRYIYSPKGKKYILCKLSLNSQIRSKNVNRRFFFRGFEN